MTIESVRALRGATTVDEDLPEQITMRTVELLDEIMAQNNLEVHQVISIFFTSTPDLVSHFPATAARINGFGAVPLICAQEIPVPNAMPRCIRLMMHLNTTAARDELHHVYLHDAKSLRDDLPR
jgi:chorismate mutase